MAVGPLILPRPRSRVEVMDRVERHLEAYRRGDDLDGLRESVVLARQQAELLRRTFLSRFTPHDKQMEFFKAGVKYRVRAVFGANRSGKTVGGCAETAYHAIGVYPDWWTGRRFDRPQKIWVGGKTFDKVKEGVQKMLLGSLEEPGTGFIPANRILKVTANKDVDGCADEIHVRWGPFGQGTTLIKLKAYSQGRDAFETEKVGIIHLDEEPKEPVYNECLMRLFDSEDGGIMYLTFTPLEGMTKVCRAFLKRREFRAELAETMPRFAEIDSMMWHAVVDWMDNPHLSERQIAEMILSMDPREREARQHGRPVMGAGLVLPFSRSEICAAPRPIPAHWPQGFGLDHGWGHPTAIVKCAKDPNSGIFYFTNVWKHVNAKPEMVADVFRSMGANGLPILGGWDGENATQVASGKSLHDMYRERGLDVTAADKLSESAYTELHTGLANGTVKVFGDPEERAPGPCEGFLEELDFFHRDENGKIVPENDDAISAGLYAFRHHEQFERPGRDPFGLDSPFDEDYEEPDYPSAGHYMPTGGTWRSA